MSFINLTTPPRGIHNGKLLSFIAPCDSNELEGLSIDGKNYPLVDGMGNSITECGKVFKKDSIVTVTINTLLQLAVIDTNSFSTFVGVTDDSTENGSAGLVPAPLMTDKGKFLGSSGKWEDISSVIDSFIDALPSILSFENITVPVSSFIQVNEELYKANITLEHCTEKYFPIIKFEDDKGVMTKECETSLNTLTVYATALPDGDVVLSSVLLIGNGYVGGDPVIAEYSSNLEFPMQGQEGIIYLAKDENVLYRWDTILGAYVTLTSSGTGLTDEEKAKVDALPNPSIMSNLLIGGTNENDEITDAIKETLVSADILGNKYTVAILDRTFAEINEIMSNISDFTNKDILEKFSLTEDGKLLFDGNEIGVTLSNKELLEKFSLSEDGKLLFDGKELSKGNSEEIGYGYLGWLQSIEVTDTYNSLEEVLINEKLVRELMTKHASCDYLFQWLESNPDILDSFTSNQIAMKWIGLRDYICDKLIAVDAYKEKLLSSDFWKYILKDHVPKMNSTTTPYGETNSSSNFVGSVTYSSYLAFNRVSPTNTNPGNAWLCSGTSGWIYYKFTNPIKVKRLTLQNFDSTLHTGWDLNCCVKTFTVEASNDGNTWDTILNETQNPNTSANVLTVDIDNDKYYLYYRLSIVNNHGYSNYTIIDEIQFYGRSLNVSVPTMTSNTEPYGEITAIGSDSPFLSYYAFDGVSDTEKSVSTGRSIWSYYGGTESPWIQYNFFVPVCCKMLFVENNNTGSKYRPTKITIMGSNDGVEFISIAEITDKLPTSDWGKSYITIDNDESYSIYRIVCNTSLYDNTEKTNYGCFANINFYCIDKSERENKDYIYDHGLEIKPVYTITSENGTAVKNEESLSQSTPGTNDVGYFGTDSALDLSTKKVARVVYGDTIAPNSNSIYPWILCSPTKYTGSPSNYTATKRVVKEDLPNNASLNLSNINDSEYVYCGTAGGNNGAKSEIVEWWLE